MRRNRQFLSTSTVIVGKPSGRASDKKKIDFNSSYTITDGRFISLQSNEVTVSIPWDLSNNKKKQKIENKYHKQAELVESESEKKMRAFLALKNDNGGKQIRALRNITLEKVGLC